MAEHIGIEKRLERVESDLRKQLWGGIAAVTFLLTAMFTFYTKLDSKIDAINQNLINILTTVVKKG